MEIRKENKISIQTHRPHRIDMATKKEKRDRERDREAQKLAQKKLNEHDEVAIANLENFCTYQVLYMNDCACNAILALGSDIPKMNYKTKRPTILYEAMKKRINTYFSAINRSTFDLNSLASLFERLDELVDAKITKVRHSIDGMLAANNIENHEWIAKVETARILLSYAKVTAEGIADEIRQYSPRAYMLRSTLPKDLMDIMDSFCDYVQIAAHINQGIDLNECQDIVDAVDAITSAFFNPQKINTIFTDAERECKENNYAALM